MILSRDERLLTLTSRITFVRNHFSFVYTVNIVWENKYKYFHDRWTLRGSIASVSDPDRSENMFHGFPPGSICRHRVRITGKRVCGCCDAKGRKTRVIPLTPGHANTSKTKPAISYPENGNTFLDRVKVGVKKSVFPLRFYDFCRLGVISPIYNSNINCYVI